MRIKRQDISVKNRDEKIKPRSFTALQGTNGLNYPIFIIRLSRLTFFLGSWFLTLEFPITHHSPLTIHHLTQI